MDYVRLATENSQLSNYAKQSNNILLKFNSLLKTIHKQNETYISKIQKQLEEFHSELQHAPIYTTMHYNFTNFTNQFNDFLTNTHKINEQFQNQIIVPLISFSSAQSKKRSKNLATFETFIKHITETKIKLEKTKHIYFDSVKETRQQERNVVKIIEQGKQDEIKKAHALLYQLEDITDKKTIFYNEELAKMNLVLEEGEKTYNEIISSLQTEEENCFKYLNEVFINMQNLTKTVHSNQNICIEKMQKSINLTNIKRDMSVYINNYDFKNEKKNRFDKELFFNYDDYIRSLEQATVPQKNELLDKIEDKKILFEQKNAITSSKASLNDLNITTISASTTSLIKDKKEDNEHNTKDINNKKGNQSYKKIINQLIHSSNPISNDELVIIFNEIQNNPDKSKEFLEQLKDYYDGHVFVSIENEYNMHHLTSIFILILNSLQTKEEMFISCIFTIISMSEETLYIDPNSIFNKYYLCKFLSYKHKKLFTKELWMKLIEIQISFLLDKEIKQIIEKKEQITKTDDRTVLNKVKNIFSLSQNKIKENRKIENNILYGKLYQERQPFVAVKILEDFLQHFACFNCDISISNEIVIELAQKYKFSQEHSNYFRAILNSNLFGEDRDFKNETFYQQKHSVNPNIDYSLQIFYKNNLFHKITQKNRDENTFIIIINSCKYLHPKELIDILCINKSYNRKASKIIYKNILLKYHNMNIDSRMKLWKSIINIFKIKREYNYKNIINTLKSSGTKDIPNNDIIDMDVLRTPFETNRKENKTKISNILKALAKAVPHIKYSQGMNYIAAFILNLFKDEEESFYFYVALLKTTQYGELFINDLEKLKMFFYVFERILKLFSPELMNYLTRSNITVSYFISPWFITLFTNSYNFIKNKELPKVLLMIWEQFLFGGWEEIIKFGTYLIKYYEKQLLDIKTEELLQFLLNDLIKTSFFQNDNYNTLMYINSNLEIEDGLVKNIENEYELKKKLGSGFQEDKMTV